MSDSDSDLEFESADEDTTEHETSEASEKDNVNLKAFENELKISEIKKDDVDSLPSGCGTDTDGVSNIQNLEKLEISEELFSEKKEIESDVTQILTKPKKESRRIPLRLEEKKYKKSLPEEEIVSQNVEDVMQESNTVQDSSTNKDNNKSSSWGFSSWSTSLLSTAASSVSTFSSQVSQGIGTVFETVESTLGAPSPEALAATLKENKEELDESNVAEDNEGLGLLPDVSLWTKALESTGSKVLMGGLDTLELIGKKTMDILTEGDPGLRNKRHIFADGVNLSQILREAKEKAEKEALENDSENDIINYSQIFDDQQGLIHLEALEILSKQTQAKFQRLLMRQAKKVEVKKRLEEVKSICENIPSLDDPSPTENEEFQDFESVFRKHALELILPLSVDNIVTTQKRLNDTILNYENNLEEPHITPDEIFRTSICCLAEFTARCIEIFHKIAELILVQPENLGPDIELRVTNLTGLTTVMCVEINNLSSRLHKCLDSTAEHFLNYTNSQGLNITAMVTNLYVEASNSNKYIQDAFQMLVPVFQVCLLESLNE